MRHVRLRTTFQYLPEMPVPLTTVKMCKKPLSTRQRARFVIGIAVLAVSLVLGMAVISNKSINSTDAVWNASQSSAASFAAGTVPAPEIQSCRVVGLLTPRAEITWSVPAELREGFDLSQVEIYVQRGLVGNLISLSDRDYDLEDNTTGGPTQYT